MEHGWFGRSAHLHGHVSTLWAFLECALVSGDEYLKDFVRFGYERARMLGIPRLGCFIWTTEACATSDMVAPAIRLSELGVGDYWPDVEAYIRNQMSEEQLVDRDLIEEVAGTGPKREVDPPQVISDRVLDGAVGSFAANASPTRIYTGWTICCPANGSLALYYAWESMLRHRDGNLQVHMLLNRVSPWLDVSSWLPYEGKVVMVSKSAQSVSVRVPRWVDECDLQISVNGAAHAGQRIGAYLLVEQLKPGDVVAMTFPVPAKEHRGGQGGEAKRGNPHGRLSDGRQFRYPRECVQDPGRHRLGCRRRGRDPADPRGPAQRVHAPVRCADSRGRPGGGRRARAHAGGVWVVTADNAYPEEIPCSAPSGVIDLSGDFVCRTESQGEELFAHSTGRACHLAFSCHRRSITRPSSGSPPH